MAHLNIIVVVVITGILGTTLAQNFYVVAPNTFRLNSVERVAVAMEGKKQAMVRVFIQDYPGKRKNISQAQFALQPDKPELVDIRLDPADFPPNFLDSPGYPKLVSLTASTDNNLVKEIVVPISIQSGYVFIQTDKPIYTPDQRAHLRIISLSEEVSPSDKAFQLQIKNPRGIIIDEKQFNQNAQERRKAFVTHIYKFPTYPVLGEWSATVRYGYNLQQNTTVHFELKEYVLPTFTVELKTPDVILPSDDSISIDAVAKHVYGKDVQGVATFRLGVKGETPTTVFFITARPKELVDGRCKLNIDTEELKTHKDIGWFPGIEGSRLVVEVTVLDAATGNKAVATDAKGRFSKSPFQISFKRCLQDFKPGLISIFEADINYVDGRPAEGITTKISAMADGKPLNIAQEVAVSDENGKLTFEIHPEISHSTLSITLKTDDPRYAENQAIGNFVQRKFNSPNKAYIALDRSLPRTLKPGSMFTKTVHFEPPRIPDTYYLVVSKGRILDMKKLKAGQYKTQQVEFPITHEMVPSFRVLVFAHHGTELLADSLEIPVERVCDPMAKVTITEKFDNKEPGNVGKIVINGNSGTLVGLLGVDEAVYALSKKDLLTEAKVFDKFASHDLGCGPGGGLSVDSVLGNAGIAIGTNKYSPTMAHTCVEIKRRKRNAVLDIVSMYEGLEKQCCSMGIQKDKFNRNCDERFNIVVRQLQGEFSNCSKAFLDCCNYAKENGISMILRPGLKTSRAGGENFDEPDFISADEEEFYESGVTVRSDFRETWIYEDILIGPDKEGKHEASLPHSITTWVIQAVSVSNEHGICVAEPLKLVSFKPIFLHLNLPYSVVRNEQVEIQATVFNYKSERIRAVVYMYGAEHLCSGIQPDTKSERKRLIIDPKSAKTVTFPVIPLKIKDYSIKVVVLTPEGSDVIQKKLHVVAEGVTKEIDIPIKLDPSNQQRRAKRHINNEIVSDTIDTSQNLQVTAVKLGVPEGFVPGTESCSITAIGDQFGPAVETTINNPDALLLKPRGCGEQNMMFLAPTMYTMKYLKSSGKLTAASEEKGYQFIRHGYGNQLSFRKEDGSYAAYQNKPTSTWLTAFVMKVFCQADELIHIDPNVLCSGVRWLIENQEIDGSYMEKHPMYHVDMMGGVQGKTPMTAFTLIALEECKCDEENLVLAKKRAVDYLENHLGEVQKPLPVAIVAYALALSDSELKQAANDRLLSLAKKDEDRNMMFWETQNSAQDVETAGYALLTQLLHNSLDNSGSIVNWLNTKQLQSGSFKSTQDTVVALQSLSEYAIRAQQPSINLVANVSSSNDWNFHRVLRFDERNALVMQEVKVGKVGGTLFINTQGHGVGSLAVKLRYNVNVPPEERSKFNVTVDVTDAEKEENEERVEESFDFDPEDAIEKLPRDVIRGVDKALKEEVPVMEVDPRNRASRLPLISSLDNVPLARSLDQGERQRVKRENQVKNSKSKLKISICARYLGKKDAEMSIVDAGIFSGFVPVLEELKKLQEDPRHLIQRYEISSRGVVFYLQKVPVEKKYCFAFPVVQEFDVGNTQRSVVKVYDYYNPDEITTQFYSPASNSSILRKICYGGICECAEGGCFPEKPFAQTVDKAFNEKKKILEQIACDKFDYVWKGRVNTPIITEGGFMNISFKIDEVIKEGLEKRDMIEGFSRTLLARDNCQALMPEQKYLLMGKDGQKHQNENGEDWYRYLLDNTSEVFMWTDDRRQIKDKKTRQLQDALNATNNKLRETGCVG